MGSICERASGWRLDFKVIAACDYAPGIMPS